MSLEIKTCNIQMVSHWCVTSYGFSLECDIYMVSLWNVHNFCFSTEKHFKSDFIKLKHLKANSQNEMSTLLDHSSQLVELSTQNPFSLTSGQSGIQM